MRLVQPSALKIMYALVKDVCMVNPELSKQLNADIVRIQRVVETRGESILMTHLPDLGKAFDFGLSTGWFSEPCGLGTLRKGTLIFGSLIRQCFDTTGKLYDKPSIETIMFVRQLCYMFKKVKIPCPVENIRKTVEEFVKVDRSLRPPSKMWTEVNGFTSDKSGFGRPSLTDVIIDAHRAPLLMFEQQSDDPGFRSLMSHFQQVCDIVLSTMKPPVVFDLLPKHGPGSVSDMKEGVFKYNFPNWPPRLEVNFPFSHFAVHDSCPIYSNYDEDYRSEEPIGRLLAVPKTYSKPRLITSEPVSHQFCQQAILRHIRQVMPNVLSRSINFKDQTPSKDMAIEASILNSNLATVDLSMASDRLSCWTIERVFRTQPELLNLLASVRTRYVKDATKSDTFGILKLRKFAGQGSATTFPIQSIVYCLAALTAALHDRRLKVTLRNIRKVGKYVRVFGDDIVIPSGRTLVYLDIILSALQLKVNSGKSFFQGEFRESCGMDAYDGYEVTPVYLTHLSPGDKAESLQSWVDVSNTFHREGYWHTSSYMDSLLSKAFRRKVPISRRADDYALALYTYTDGYFTGTRQKFNDDLQLWEGRLLTIQTDAKRVQGVSNQYMLQYFTEAPASFSTGQLPSMVEWQHGILGRKSVKLKTDWVPLG